MVYESLNSGGIAWATNGTTRLGGTLGQSGFITRGTNTMGWMQSGFWKADCPCETVPLVITALTLESARLGITFPVLNSNRYQVVYISQEEGGPPAGTHAWTNALTAAFTAAGRMGSTTTVWDNVSSAPQAGRYYLIRCE